MKKKRCSTCKAYKKLSDFTFRRYLNRYRGQCKVCVAKRTKKYNEDNWDHLNQKQKDYYNNHKKERAEYGKAYRENNKDKVSERHKKYNRTHKKELAEYGKRYRELNKGKISKRMKEYSKTHKKERAEYNKKYAKLNRDKVRARKRKRRALENKVNEYFTIQDERFTYDLFKHKCFNCNCKDELCVSHFIV
jgi:hypothetical protein